MQKQGQTGNFFVMHPEAMSQSKQFKPIEYISNGCSGRKVYSSVVELP